MLKDTGVFVVEASAFEVYLWVGSRSLRSLQSSTLQALRLRHPHCQPIFVRSGSEPVVFQEKFRVWARK